MTEWGLALRQCCWARRTGILTEDWDTGVPEPQHAAVGRATRDSWSNLLTLWLRKRRPRWRRACPTACSRSLQAVPRNAPCHTTPPCPPFIQSPTRHTFIGHQLCARSCAEPGAADMLPAGCRKSSMRVARRKAERPTSVESLVRALPCVQFSFRPRGQPTVHRHHAQFSVSEPQALGCWGSQPGSSRLPTPRREGEGGSKLTGPASFPCSARWAPPPIKP